MRFYLLLVLACMGTYTTYGQKNILINNVEIFNGKDEATIKGNVLIVDNLISKVSTTPIPVNRRADTQIIEGQGKFLMPGLIDAHVHLLMESIPQQVAMSSDVAYINLFAVKSAENQLMRGFTSVRDLGGASISLKKAIDQGLVKGPRVYPSGATISQTGGHGDFGMPTDVPRQIGGPMGYLEQTGMTSVADGADQVLMRTRENLRQGATQIKLMAGGGVASDYDPLDVTQYTEAEFRAAVEAAENWGTYVTVHAYTPKAVQSAVKAGVKCVEHGQLIDEETAQILAEKGIWLCLQPFLDDEDAIPFKEGSENRKKQLQMVAGTENAYNYAKKHGVKVAFGTDALFDAKLASRQGAQLAKLSKWYSPYEVLKMATSTNAELLRMSGPRNPYPNALGVIEEGAYADLILVDGNPIRNLDLIANPGEKFLLIMKDGEIYKNKLN
ncbi:metal-dependent hydrolase family protein [Pararhodonellum marinum]|uniref:metal-dependent hydrolase family protein n=1 Tax=Pararhodonellum marinum TaxID=2755358 RepID=UPI00188EE330|nr:amidohydrolase family protein [Pararhodonellum marinum]